MTAERTRASLTLIRPATVARGTAIGALLNGEGELDFSQHGGLVLIEFIAVRNPKHGGLEGWARPLFTRIRSYVETFQGGESVRVVGVIADRPTPRLRFELPRTPGALRVTAGNVLNRPWAPVTPLLAYSTPNGTLDDLSTLVREFRREAEDLGLTAVVPDPEEDDA